MSNRWMLKRIAAAIIDQVILIGIPLGCYLIFVKILDANCNQIEHSSINSLGALGLAWFFLALAFAYRLFKDCLFITGRPGCSFGKRFLGLRVISTKRPDSPPEYLESAGRNFLLLAPIMWFVEILAISINPRGLSIGDRIAHTQVIEDTPGSSIGFLSIILLTLLASAYSLPRLNQQIQQRAQLLLTFAFNSAANYVPAIRDAGEPRTIKPDDFYQIVKPIWGRFRLDAGFTIQGPLGTGNLHGTFLDHPLQVKAQKWTFHTADLLIKVDYYELLVSRGQWNSIVEQFKADQSVLFSQDPYVRSILLRVAPMVARSFQQLGDKPKAAYYYALAAKLLAENSSRDPNVKNYLEQAEQLDPTNDLIGQVKKLTHK